MTPIKKVPADDTFPFTISSEAIATEQLIALIVVSISEAEVSPITDATKDSNKAIIKTTVGHINSHLVYSSF